MMQITSHLPFWPHFFKADNSKNTSEYSKTVKYNLSFSPAFTLFSCLISHIILSLYRINRFDRQ